MSYDLVIWKRSASARTAMLDEVYDAIGQGQSHPAMQSFDMDALQHAIKQEFGEPDENGHWIIACAPGRTDDANWLEIQCSFADADSVVSRVVPTALDLELLVYDPQRQCVWGNKRPAKKKK